MNISSLYSSVPNRTAKAESKVRTSTPDVQVEVWDLNKKEKRDPDVPTQVPEPVETATATPKPSSLRNGWIYDRTQSVKPQPPSEPAEINKETRNGIEVDAETRSEVMGGFGELLGGTDALGVNRQVATRTLDPNDWSPDSNTVLDPQLNWLITQKLYSGELEGIEGAPASVKTETDPAIQNIISAVETLTGMDAFRLGLQEHQLQQSSQIAKQKMLLVEAILQVVDSNRPDAIAILSETLYGEWFAPKEQIYNNHIRFETVKARLRQEIALQPIRVLESCIHSLRQINL
jgi:hypothetical protein